MKIFLSILLTLTLFVMLAGCDSAGEDIVSEDTVSTVDVSDDEEITGEEITITHKLGEATFMTNPEKVAVMDFGVLDILTVVGLEDRVVGLPKAHLPEYLSHFEKDQYTDLGNLVEANFEELNKLDPDLIIISSRFTDSYEEFSNIAPTLFVEMPGSTYIETFEENIQILSQVFTTHADELQTNFNELNAQIDTIAEESDGKTALLIQTNDDAVSVFGLNSRYAAIYTTFGFTVTDESIEQSTHGQSVSFEYVAEQNPEYLFIIDRSAAISTDGTTGAQALLDNNLINGMDAVKNGKVSYLDSTNWYMVAGGITSTSAMIEEIQEALGL